MVIVSFQLIFFLSGLDADGQSEADAAADVVVVGSGDDDPVHTDAQKAMSNVERDVTVDVGF